MTNPAPVRAPRDASLLVAAVVITVTTVLCAVVMHGYAVTETTAELVRLDGLAAGLTSEGLEVVADRGQQEHFAATARLLQGANIGTATWMAGVFGFLVGCLIALFAARPIADRLTRSRQQRWLADRGMRVDGRDRFLDTLWTVEPEESDTGTSQ